jgi:Ser/Thr protein kinase RdoA (MazF antagonist)
MSDKLFPVSYSTLSCSALTAQVLNNYSIGMVQNCQMWARGLSDVYVVGTLAANYVLRVSHAHWRSGDEIEFEMEFLEFLNQHKVPVAHPLRNQAGQLKVALNAPEGTRYATLLIYAPGQIPLGDFNRTQSHKLGETVAKLHQASQYFQPTVSRQSLTLEYLLDDSLELILPQVPNVAAIEYLCQTRDRLHQQLATLPKTFPFWAVCWGDPHSGNVHFTTDQKPTMFDFDQCGYGWRAFDVAKFLQMALCSGMSYVVRDAFLEGYQATQPLTDLEWAALTSLTQVAHLWRWAISLGDALRHDSSRLDHYYFMHRVEQLKMLGNQDWQAMQLVARGLAKST